MSPTTAKSDNICQDFTVCASAQFEVSAATPFSDRVCQVVGECNIYSQYQAKAATATSNVFKTFI